ncbi:chain-length determining protein [Photobacterium angustum]|uniref:Chain-length determining protein n=1 Tax=Photobacterium angustum TaxID=661 RepID=A0ABX5GXS6_PHOAN|nr:Wzz/FepE/Etk N-terminal domain-containing protein [Photobacterium angustum]KJG39108.1 chain-length determining protein [Photobacterium angustum]PSX01045.1 chain-length determining protein [Photobacterium angustum]
MSDIQAANNSPSDEIDLIELVKTLWQGKVMIVVCTVIFTVCAIVYALTAQQWWTSKAVITVSQYQNSIAFRNQVSNLYTVYSKDSAKLNELKSMFNKKNLFNDFVTEFNAFDNKKTFIEKTPILEKQINATDADKRHIFISNWAEKFSASQVDKKDPYVFYIRSQAESAQQSYQLLTAYSNFISAKVREDLTQKLVAKIENSDAMLKAKEMSLSDNAKKLLANELIRTKYSLDIARSANVTKPIADMNEQEFFQINLGTEALTEKIKILEKSKDLSLFEPKLSDVETNLSLLKSIKLDPNVKLQSIRFLQNIDYPISRDKPNRKLIVIIGLILGFVFGSSIVLIRPLFNK